MKVFYVAMQCFKNVQWIELRWKRKTFPEKIRNKVEQKKINNQIILHSRFLFRYEKTFYLIFDFFSHSADHVKTVCTLRSRTMIYFPFFLCLQIGGVGNESKSIKKSWISMESMLKSQLKWNVNLILKQKQKRFSLIHLRNDF